MGKENLFILILSSHRQEGNFIEFSFSPSLKKNCYRLFQKKISTPFVYTEKKTDFFKDLARKFYIPSFRPEQGCHRTRVNITELKKILTVVYFIIWEDRICTQSFTQSLSVFQIHHGHQPMAPDDFHHYQCHSYRIKSV